MSDLVSVIIINYNTLELTRNCISSVIKQTKGVAIEVIVIDNASAGNDVAQLHSEFPGINIIRNSENVGFARANNQGIALATGNFILLLNSDTRLIEDSITQLYQAIKRSDDIAVVTGNLVFENGKLQGCCMRFPSVWLFLFEFLRLQKLVPNQYKQRILLGSFFSYDREVYPDWVWGTSMLIRKAAIDRLPFRRLDERFFMYCEDMQWCLDFRKMGYIILFTPATKIIHLMGGSSANKKEMLRKNLDTFFDYNYSAPHAAILKFLYRFYYKL